MQTKEEAIKIDHSLKTLLNQVGIEFDVVTGSVIDITQYIYNHEKLKPLWLLKKKI